MAMFESIDDVLNFQYDKWDLPRCTIRHYLVELASTCWMQNEGFSGKRPFGNSGWQYDVYRALAAGGFVEPEVDEDGEVYCADENEAEKVIMQCFRRLQEG